LSQHAAVLNKDRPVGVQGRVMAHRPGPYRPFAPNPGGHSIRQTTTEPRPFEHVGEIVESAIAMRPVDRLIQSGAAGRRRQ
jgi:hypothetical protein